MPGDTRLLPAGLRVLLVEDEAMIAMDGEAILLQQGVQQVVLTRSVEDALRAIEAEKIHAAILDLRLGEETSLPVAHRLETLGIPYGFLTGYRDDDIPAAFRSRPMVTKPFSPNQLAQLLQLLVATKGPSQTPSA